MPPTNLSGKYLAVVEGTGDEQIFSKICRESNVTEILFYSPNSNEHNGPGKDNFFSLLEGLPTIHGFDDAKGILLIQDSDDDPVAALSNIKEQVILANKSLAKDGRSYGVPQTFLHATHGTNTPAVMALSIPWIDRTGSLESLVLESAEAKFPDIKNCVDSYINCVGGLVGWNAGKVGKARLACLVAVTLKSNPTAAVHYVTSSNGFPALINHSSFDQLRDLFSNLDARFTQFQLN